MKLYGGIGSNQILIPLLLIAALRTPVEAFPSISGVSVDQITHSSARIAWTTSVPASSQIKYGLSIPYGFSTGLYGDLLTTHLYHLSGLAPGTVYHFCPSAVDGGNSSNVCDGSTDDYTFQTLVLPANHLGDPQLPNQHVDTVLPSQSGAILSVNAACSNLQSLIDGAALGDTISIPAGAICTGNFVLRNKTTGTGWVVIRTATRDSQLPSPGTRISPNDSPKLAMLRTPSTRFPGGSGQAAGAIEVEAGAHHYRFIGIEFTHTQTAVAGQTDPQPYYKLVGLDASAHHLIFDRCYFHGLGYPDRLQNVFYPFDGSNIAVVDSYISNVNFWQAMPPNSIYATEGSVVFQTDYGPGPFKLDNNHIEGVGITYFVTDDHADALVSDVEITRNHFYNDDRYRYGSPVSDGRYYLMRQFFELKKGLRFFVNGNVFENQWADVNGGYSIELAIHYGGGTGLVQLGEITITNNIIRNGSGGINLNCHDPSAAVSTKSLWNVKMANNLLDRLNGYTRFSAYGTHSTGAWGIAFSFYDGCEDLRVEHNTVFDNRGTEPFFVIDGYERSEGLIFQNNIVWFNDDNDHGGLGDEGLQGLTPPIPGKAQAALDGNWMWTPNPKWVFDHNVIVSGFLNSQTGTGTLDIAGLQPLYPAGNFWATDQASVGFANSSGGNYSLSGGPYKGQASDGSDPGVNWPALQTATLHTVDGDWGGLCGNGLPIPTLQLPLQMPVNATITASIPSGCSTNHFFWTFIPVSTPQAFAHAAAEGAAAGTLSTPTRAASFSQASLSLGTYLISVQSVDSAGNLSPASNQVEVTLVNAILSGVRVYPNPWRSDKHSGKSVIFDPVTLDSTLKIFTVSGHEVRQITDVKVVGTTPSIAWDLKNDSGEKVASGIYLYVVQDAQGNKVKGKLAVVK